MIDVVSKERNDRDRNGPSGINASEYDVLIKLSGIWHNSHRERYNQNTIQVDALPAVLVSHIAHERRREEFNNDVEGDDKGVFKVFDVLAFIYVELLL